MKKNVAVRDYHLSDARFIQMMDEKIDALTADLNELQQVGVTQSRISQLAQMRETFADFPDDQLYEGRQMLATEKKRDAREALLVEVNRFITAALNQWPRESARFRHLGISAPTQLTDDELVRGVRNLIRGSQELLADLANEGITPADLTQLNNLRVSFDEAVDEQAEAIRKRDIATEDRITLANAAYAEMVKLCRSARNYWRDKNEARYNDYVIYGANGAPVETDENTDI